MGDWFDVGSAGVQAATGIFSNILTGYRERKAREWQEEMWNKQNEYNLPINQRKRLEEAGINPNLAFGSSASAMGTNMPSSPTVHSWNKSEVGEFMLRLRQARSEIRAQEAATNRQNEETERLRLNNQIVSSLLQDTIETRRGQMFIDRLIQGWQEDHQRELMDFGLTAADLKNDMSQAMIALTNMRKDYTEASKDLLKQQYEHLVDKYGFEDSYYSKSLNPYETSTPIGFMRTLIGIIGDALGIKPPSVFNLPHSYDPAKANNFDREY